MRYMNSPRKGVSEESKDGMPADRGRHCDFQNDPLLHRAGGPSWTAGPISNLQRETLQQRGRRADQLLQPPAVGIALRAAEERFIARHGFDPLTLLIQGSAVCSLSPVFLRF